MNVITNSLKALKPKSTPKLFVIDWDETITNEDTIKLVAQAAYNKKKEYEPKFDHFTDIYMKAFNEYNENFTSKYGERDTIEKEIKFQTGMQNVEMSSINEIKKLKLFEGIDEEEFLAQGNHVTLKPHFTEFLTKCQELKIPVIILSVNWTKLIMQAVLLKNGFKENENLKIMVNELEFKNGISTGNFNKAISIRTGLDKLNIVNSLIKQYGKTCYIGDSMTDLLSLIDSDIGIAIEEGSVIESIKKTKLSNQKSK
mmetsp:Transcript_2071/g.2253  ORF Transcript_2071/g.2253 Transcript_2071/m.2253 type:complete len:256 (+) Transcript_2071:23-790(+)